MSIRLRAIGSIAAIVLIAFGLLVAANAYIVQPQFDRIEQAEAKQNTARVVDAYDNWIDQLHVKASDWAAWDDSYRFVHDHNAAFISSNLVQGSLENLDINFILFISPEGKIVESKALSSGDTADVVESLPVVLKDTFTSSKEYLSESADDLHQGVIMTTPFPIVFVSRPILPSSGNGLVHGTLVFGRYFTPDLVSQLAKLTHIDTSYYSYNSTSLPNDIQIAKAHLKSTQTSYIRALPGSTIAGYQLINDVHGKPALIVRAQQPRTIFKQASKSLAYYMIITLSVVAMLTVLIYYVSRQVVARDKTIALKDEFFSMASHELRTPLAAIKGNSQLIAREYGATNPDLAQQAEDIHASSDRLIRMVSNFLDAARLEQGKVPFNFESVHVSEVLTEIAKEVKGLADEKSLYVRVSVPADLSPVYADKDRLKQVVYNIVGNAVKYTEKGGITLGGYQMGEHVVVSVADTGRGVPESEKQQLFNRFQQVKLEDVGKGSGLGLYITKQLLAKMGGIIWVDSTEEDKGTTICFNLPKARRDA